MNHERAVKQIIVERKGAVLLAFLPLPLSTTVDELGRKIAAAKSSLD